jgi:flagellar biosynthesis protein FliP
MSLFPALLAATEPNLQLSVSGGGSAPVKMFLLLTALSFASAALISLTSFTRIIIVLSFLRQALGTPQLPPNQVLLGLALALSAFVMAPTASRIQSEALGPLLDDKMSQSDALTRAAVPVREFLLRQTRPDDLALFYDISHRDRPENLEEVPLSIAAPAFMVSELTTAFRMGLFLYIPLVLVDLLISAILMSLGMAMVPPTMLALPLKIGIFLLADGWHLTIGALARSF